LILLYLRLYPSHWSLLLKYQHLVGKRVDVVPDLFTEATKLSVRESLIVAFVKVAEDQVDVRRG